MRLKEYWDQIEAWKKTYGNPKPVYTADPTSIKAACDRCGKLRKRMSRHHVANDFMFACMRPDDYAARYIQFHPDDVRKLCNRCHKAAHRHYEPILVELYAELNKIGLRGVTKEWCEKWRKRFRDAYFSWVKTYKPRLATKHEEAHAPRFRGRKRGKKVRRTSPRNRPEHE